MTQRLGCNAQMTITVFSLNTSEVRTRKMEVQLMNTVPIARSKALSKVSALTGNCGRS